MDQVLGLKPRLEKEIDLDSTARLQYLKHHLDVHSWLYVGGCTCPVCHALAAGLLAPGNYDAVPAASECIVCLVDRYFS